MSALDALLAEVGPEARTFAMQVSGQANMIGMLRRLGGEVTTSRVEMSENLQAVFDAHRTGEQVVTTTRNDDGSLTISLAEGLR